MSESHRRPVLIYLTDDERQQLQELADANSRSISGEGRAAVRAWIEQRGNDPRSVATQIRATLANGGLIHGSTLVSWARALDKYGAYSASDDNYINRRYELRT